MKKRVLLIAILGLFLCSMFAYAQNWGFSGSKAISKNDHLPHKQNSMYYTEQWSGTVFFGKNHNLNFNLVHSKLTTKSKKGMFRVEYNTPDGKTIEESTRCDIKIKRDPFMLVCGKGIIKGPVDNLKVQFTGDKLPVILSMKALNKPFRPGDGVLTSPDKKSDFYNFMLMIPRAKVNAKIGGKLLQGNGTMDHSFTNIGVHKISRHWIRSTYIDKDISIIFAANWLKGGDSTGWVAITNAMGDSYVSSDVNFSFGDIMNDPDKSGYFAPRSIKIMSNKANEFSLELSNMKLKVRKDMLAHLSRFEAFVVRRFSDPIKYNMYGTAKVKWPVKGVQQNIERNLVAMVKQMNE